MIVQSMTLTLRTNKRIIVSFEYRFLFFSNNGTTFWADKIFFRFTKRMFLLTFIVFNNKRMAVWTLPTYITRHHAMRETYDFFFISTIATPNYTSTTHSGKTQIWLIWLQA